MAKSTLLLVDDDKLSSQILGYILTYEGYQVDFGETGSEALKKLMEHKYDLVILDYNLPDMKGHDIAQRLKSFSPETKIILLTGLTMEVEANNMLYDRTLLKPVSPEGIIKTIGEILT